MQKELGNAFEVRVVTERVSRPAPGPPTIIRDPGSARWLGRLSDPHFSESEARRGRGGCDSDAARRFESLRVSSSGPSRRN